MLPAGARAAVEEAEAMAEAAGREQMRRLDQARPQRVGLIRKRGRVPKVWSETALLGMLLSRGTWVCRPNRPG